MCVFLLQDFSCTNAGIGSNLTKSGAVECDASIMDGQSLTFGAVGAIKGLLNNDLIVFCRTMWCETKTNV